MTIRTLDTLGSVALDCDIADPAGASVEVLVMMISGQTIPPWLDDHGDQLRVLREGERLTLHRHNEAPYLAEIVEILYSLKPTRRQVRKFARTIGLEHRNRYRFAIAGLASEPGEASNFAAGFCEGRYQFTRYRSNFVATTAELLVLGSEPSFSEQLRTELRHAEITEVSVHWCRDLTNTPARDLTPVLLADEAVRGAQNSGALVQVYDEDWLRAERFAGILSVGAGSPHASRLVEVSYCGERASSTPPIVLVGKGITFDSGGLSLKRASAMMEMKSDMAGAATVLAAVCALARMAAPDVHVVALLTLAENLPGPNALRPGDVIQHRNGLTTEVVNTDCEGRLALSDALTWASEKSPDAIIDVATLTYSTIAALGIEVTSVIGNNSELIGEVIAAGAEVGEPLWELPLWEPYRRLIDSPFADLRNEEIGVGAGAITAALFLREFVGDAPWAHLDTGGTAYLDEELDGLGVGATGTGVRSLIKLILDRQGIQAQSHKGGTR